MELNKQSITAWILVAVLVLAPIISATFNEALMWFLIGFDIGIVATLNFIIYYVERSH